MSTDIYKLLSFGVKKTAKAKQADVKKEQKGEELRMRVLPKDFNKEKQIRKPVEDMEQEEEETGVQLFAASGLSLDEEEEEGKGGGKKKRVFDPEYHHKQKIAGLRKANKMYTWGDAVPDPFIEWAELKLPERLMENIEQYGIKEPTPIQMQAIPIMMEKRDVLASAPTGSGKTLAFSAPVIAEITRLKKMDKYKDAGHLLAIVLEPTRELAAQTYRQFLKFGEGLPVKAALMEGETVPQGVDVIVSTPGHIVYALQGENKPNVEFLRFLIVDEADRLFEVVEGDERCFRNQLATIYRACDGKWTRRAFFSATLSHAVEEWCKQTLMRVAMCCIGGRNVSNSSVQQELVFCGSEQGKIVALRSLMHGQFDPPCLIFVQSKERARQVMAAIDSFNPPIPAGLVSSERSQQQRDAAIEQFRSGKLWVLVCTELAGRGLDLKGVNLVINFDLPQSVIAYIHRVGRTGRAGRVGRALTYFTESDMKLLRPIATVIQQAGFEVPEYTLKLSKPSRDEKKTLLKRVPHRKDVVRLQKKHPKGGKGKKGGEKKEEQGKEKGAAEKKAGKAGVKPAVKKAGGKKGANGAVKKTETVEKAEGGKRKAPAPKKKVKKTKKE